MDTIPRPGDSGHELELEALLRLAAARRLLDAVACGEWLPEDFVLGHSELLIRQARRRLAAARALERRAA